jgi:hypothetical protein
MAMLQGDPLLRRVNEIIDRVVEAGLYNGWITRKLYSIKLREKENAICVQQFVYYNFNLHHLQPAFYLLLMGCCLSAISFVFELLYNRILSKRK